ncbi:hypothetical protein RUM43_014502 [Polyplax serrata]|uniref:UBX domain-containing protein n=1 Tax=Polyplax serrata TaxID=468196 RepID=A0AAN8PGM2_POLSC
MIDKIQKFFKNKKAEAAFKRAGPGYRLNETPSQDSYSSRGASSSTSNVGYQPVQDRSGLSQESQQAAAAALARLDKKKNENSFKKTTAAIKAQARKELEAQKAAEATAQSASIPETVLDSVPALAVRGIYFQCPLLGPDILTKEEWNQKIRDFLYEQLDEEKGLVACLILRTLNGSKEKVDACIETIEKYFENILKYPNEEKYRKIRMTNKIFEEKVKPIEGALLLLEAAGFQVQELPHQDTHESFLIFPKEKVEEAPETFEILLEGLKNAEPITLQLHRDLQVLLPSQAKDRNELPSSFFNLTVEEIKQEQFLRSEAVERNQILRTKAMREKEDIREIRKYKFALIRIRFPDGILLQGTFGVHEKVDCIIEFVKEALEDENMAFNLSTPQGQVLGKNSEQTLISFKLVPATILTFVTDAPRQTYLKPEVLMLVESLTISK